MPRVRVHRRRPYNRSVTRSWYEVIGPKERNRSCALQIEPDDRIVLARALLDRLHAAADAGARV